MLDGAGDTFDAKSWLNSYSSCSNSIAYSYNLSSMDRSIDSSHDSCDSSNTNTSVVAKAAIVIAVESVESVEWYYR